VPPWQHNDMIIQGGLHPALCHLGKRAVLTYLFGQKYAEICFQQDIHSVCNSMYCLTWHCTYYPLECVYILIALAVRLSLMYLGHMDNRWNADTGAPVMI